MTRTAFRLAAIAIALAPMMAVADLAGAQSALPDPAVPGSGYQIRDVTGPAGQITSAIGNPAVPGDGYQVGGGAALQAPMAPVTTQSGAYPSHYLQQ